MDTTITTTRIINAAPQDVFTAWTDPSILKNWWGPKGFTNTFHEFDLRPGGTWKFTMHGPDAGHYQNECVFERIESPSRIEWYRVSQPLFRVSVLFESHSENQTRITWKMIFETQEMYNKLKDIVPEKNEENLDRLEEQMGLSHG